MFEHNLSFYCFFQLSSIVFYYALYHLTNKRVTRQKDLENSVRIFFSQFFSVSHTFLFSLCVTMEVKFINTLRKKVFAVHAGYLFKEDKRVGNKSYWRCIRHVSCKSRIILDNNLIFKIGKFAHNHEPTSNEIRQMEFKSKLVDKIKDNPSAPITRIYDEEFPKAAATVEASASLPSFGMVKSTLYRVRSSLRPSLPADVTDLILTDVFKKTIDGREFLLIDFQENSKRTLVFCTKENLKILCDSRRLFMDGTFRLVPQLFSQLYTIHGFWMDKVMPLAYCLLPDKFKSTYVAVLEKLKQAAIENGITFYPPWIMLDFESSALVAVKEVFPTTELKGCYFHFTQCIFRKAQKLGLTAHFDGEVKTWIRRLAALPLVPENRLDEAFFWIQGEAPDIPNNTAMHNYIVETFLDDNALFTKDLWNHYRNMNERTNNAVEGWHSSFNKRSNTCHLNIFSFIELLQKDEDRNSGKLRMLQAGHKTPPGNRKYVILNDRLNNLKRRLYANEIDLKNYIDTVSYYIHFEL